jgi:hypothetical protein
VDFKRTPRRFYFLKLDLMGHILSKLWPIENVSPNVIIRGPTRQNTYFEGVSDHGDKHDLVLSGFPRCLMRRVDSVKTV